MNLSTFVLTLFVWLSPKDYVFVFFFSFNPKYNQLFTQTNPNKHFGFFKFLKQTSFFFSIFRPQTAHRSPQAKFFFFFSLAVFFFVLSSVVNEYIS